MTPTRALSIRQPYAEQILRGTKKFEYRSRPTNIRERVFIYASLQPAEGGEEEVVRDDLPRGVIVGTVEIVGCRREGERYAWKLLNPQRFTSPIKPARRPQPVWFKPF